MSNSTKHDYTWVDILRILACFLVVLAHCCDPYVGRVGTNLLEFRSGAVWATMCRVSVPLFVMLSGVLLLPTSMRLVEFFSRRLKRLLLPFVFWSIVSPFLFFAFVSVFGEVENAAVSTSAHGLKATLTAAYTWLMNFNYSTIPYWYIYMMLGLYLIIPVISAWVREASRKELKIMIYVWLFTTIIPYLQLLSPMLGYLGNYGEQGLFGVCSWNAFSTFHYVSGFVGYLILAHYLVRYPLGWKGAKLVFNCLALFAAGYAITLIGFFYTQANYPEDFTSLEIIFSFTSLNVAMMTVAVFIFFQQLKCAPSKLLAKVSESTYGVFLVHFVVVHIIYELVYEYVLIHPAVQVILIALISYVLTTILVMALRNISFFKKIS